MSEEPTDTIQEVIPEPPASSAQAPGMPAASWVRSAVRDLFGTIVPAVIIALLIHLFLAQATRVYGSSMQPNLQTNERLVVEKLSYRFHSPQRGDIVILRDPDGGPDLLIKRVIGLPGERVTVADGQVFVDGAALDEPYLNQVTSGNGRSWFVPPLSVFVMGDNRGASRDSRVFGSIPMSSILGRAIVRYWPLNELAVIH